MGQDCLDVIVSVYGLRICLYGPGPGLKAEEKEKWKVSWGDDKQEISFQILFSLILKSDLTL